MDLTGAVLTHTRELYVRAANSTANAPPTRPPTYKAIGVSLAIASGLFIGVSFVLKKTGLLKANVKYNEEAGEGYGYLKNVYWWTGMILMILGEICNFVAYAFVDAILVTPLGALSVVITTILSAIFLKERLSFVGKVGCFCCIIGSVVIALNAPQQSSVADIQEMKAYVIAPGFLTYAGAVVVGCIFTALWAGPRYGKKSMFVYLTICSLIGGLSVVATQGLGAAIVAQIGGRPQFNQWFLYVLLVFVVTTLLTEIIYLNKALNLFNAALVTPTYYVYFTSATIITSAILFQGFKGTAIEITTVVLGFFQICSGVILLQLSKSAKDVPDAAIFKGDLDQIREVAAQEEPETEPKADSIRGTAALIRRISTARQHLEVEEARRYFRERQEDQLKPPAENEIIEWDGLRRRKTIIGEGPTTYRPRTPRTPSSAKPPLPPLGMSRFPEEREEHEATERPNTKQSSHSFLDGIRSRASTVLHPSQWRPVHMHSDSQDHPMHPVALTDISVPRKGDVDTSYHGHEPDHSTESLQPPFQPRGRERSDTPRSIAWADEVPGPQSPSRGSHLTTEHSLPPQARRQFSFNSMFNRIRSGENSPRGPSSPSRGILKRTPHMTDQMKSATEEERLGLVRGDSRVNDGLIDEKLDRSSSGSESDEPGHRPPVVGQPYSDRPHQASTSTLSTTAFPPYEDNHHQYSNAESYVIYSSAQQVPSPPEIDEVEDGWQVPGGGSHGSVRPTGNNHASSSSQAQSPSRRRVNPLPPLPSESAVGDSGNHINHNGSTTTVHSAPVGARHSPDDDSPSHSSDLGVASLSSSMASDSRLDRPGGNWRRTGSDGSDDSEANRGRRGRRGPGAFI